MLKRRQVRNMEIQGLSRSNPSTEIPPAANAAIIAQMQGVLQMRKQFYQDYNAWGNTPQGAAASSPRDFTVNWMSQPEHQPGVFVNQAEKNIAYLGQEIPAPGKRVDGQRYMLQDGSIGRYNAAKKGFVIEQGPQQ
jgi:hypothetical protein